MAFHVMLKPHGAICNLDCRYCYFLGKERMYLGSGFRMSDALLETYTRQFIDAQTDEVTFAWQGGEPTLMGLDFFRRAVELQMKYAKPGMRIRNALQTNATLLDDSLCEFLRSHDFLVGVSLDGPRKFHDAYRVDKGGASTFERVMRGIALLQKHRIECNILTAVHAANARHALEVYRFLRDEVGTQFVQFIPIVERASAGKLRAGDPVTDRSVTGVQYGDFMISVFDEWVRRDVGRVSVQLFDAALGIWLGQRSSLCVFAETCGNALALEHNGDLFSCDHFVEPWHKLGNLHEDRLYTLVESDRQKRFGLDKRDQLPRYCRDCAVGFACNGGCPKDRICKTPDGEPGLNYLCEGYKSFFTHVGRPLKMMVSLLQQDRSPSEVMYLLAREEAELEEKLHRAGRNDPCLCGSGKKFKHCHGKLAGNLSRRIPNAG